MTTITITATSTAYVLATGTDNLVENASSYPARFTFSTSLPSPSTNDFHVLEAGQSYTRTGDLPSGNIYFRADLEGKDVKIVIANVTS